MSGAPRIRPLIDSTTFHVRRLAESRGWQPYQLAAFAGISTDRANAFWIMDDPNPRFATLKKIASAFGVPVTALICEQVPATHDSVNEQAAAYV